MKKKLNENKNVNKKYINDENIDTNKKNIMNKNNKEIKIMVVFTYIYL